MVLRLEIWISTRDTEAGFIPQDSEWFILPDGFYAKKLDKYSTRNYEGGQGYVYRKSDMNYYRDIQS